MSPFSNFMTAYRLASQMAKEQKEAQRFKHDLATAKRAEEPVDLVSRQYHEYPDLLNATHGENMADGTYICSCGVENYLYHKTGKYPFEYIRCRVCNRIFDDECMPTTILTPNSNPVRIPSSGLTQDMAEGMCQICPMCGLSHRVHLVPGSSEPDYKVDCHCGARSNRYWDIYYICGPESYQRNPIAASVELKVKWASRTTQKALNKRARDTQTMSAPASLAIPKPPRSTVSKMQATSSRPPLPARPHSSVGPALPVTQPEPSVQASPASPPTISSTVRRRRMMLD